MPDTSSVLDDARLKRSIETVMRRHWISAPPGLNLYEAELMMRLAGVRQVPVLENGELVGVLGYGDLLLSALEQLLRNPVAPARELLAAMAVEGVMNGSPATAAPHETLAVVARRMVDHGVGCLPVVEPGGSGARMVGLAVESDLLRIAYAPTVAVGG